MTDRSVPRDDDMTIPEPLAALRQLEPPLDLLDAVMRDVAVTPQRAGPGRLHGWPTIVLRLAAVAVALVIVANVALLLGGEQRLGPPPTDEPRPTPTRAASAETAGQLTIPEPQPVALAGEIPIPDAHAIQVIVTEDRVWAVGDDRTLYEIDPTTDEIIGQVPLPPHVPAGAVGFGSAWFADAGDDVVRRINLESGDIIAEIEVGDRPEIVAVAPDAVWVTNLHSGTISRVDPETNEVVANVEVGEPGAAGPNWIGVGEGEVWVSVPNRIAVVGVDASNNEVFASVPVDSSRALPCGEVLVQPSVVWVSSCDEREALIRVDRIDEAAESLLVPGYVGAIVAVGDVVAFTLTPRGEPTSIVLLDPISGEAVRNVTLGEYGFASIAAGFDSLWVANETGGPVMRIDLNELLP